MEFEDVQRLGILGFDERTETWYVQPRNSQRLILTRRSLARLVQMYNTIHSGNTLVLMERRDLDRMEETRRRQAAVLRDFRMREEDRQRRSLLSVLRRFLGLFFPAPRARPLRPRRARNPRNPD